MIPTAYELKRAIADFGVPWKPEIRRWLDGRTWSDVTVITDDEELWGVTKEGMILPTTLC